MLSAGRALLVLSIWGWGASSSFADDTSPPASSFSSIVLALAESDFNTLAASAAVSVAVARSDQARSRLYPTLTASFSPRGSSLNQQVGEQAGFDRELRDRNWLIEARQPLYKPELFHSIRESEHRLDHARLIANATAQKGLEQAASDYLGWSLSAHLVRLAAAELALRAEGARLVGRQRLAGVGSALSQLRADSATTLAQDKLAVAGTTLTTRLERLRRRLRPDAAPGPVMAPSSAHVIPVITADATQWLQRAQSDSTLVALAKLRAEIETSAYERRKAESGSVVELVAARSGRSGSEDLSLPAGVKNRHVGSSVELRFTIPLSSGGSSAALDRESMASRIQQQRLVAEAERSNGIDAQELFGLTQEAVHRLGSAATQLNAAMQMQKLVEAKLSAGAGLTSELIEAKLALIEHERDMVHASHQALENYLRLVSLSGRLTPSLLSRIDVLMSQPRPRE